MANVIVTGGFGVLGRAVVAELTRLGHAVAAVDLAATPADLACALALGGVDLGEQDAVEAAYTRIAEALGGIGALINVAGGFVWEPVDGGTLEAWDRMYGINLRTAVVSTRAALPHLLRDGGAVVNIGANAATQPGTGMAPYAASKSGVRALTESLAEELRGRGVRVNAVLPTIIDTPTNRTDMPDADKSGWVRPEAAARVIAFLISAEAGAITGASIPLSLAG
ncbi:SDR family NAD(P)-dependent oxidoreductase [Novosphingobium sp.]|uniref:SDR family NAD(P)-dependent oxidoreductase n=1 Tax=Novosphingobium sp. TaxID=1874826 RepID=UPI00260F2F1B|nr:SDR family NAD(P)-dependent oxidoreductase [Novosphingobium sp.]